VIGKENKQASVYSKAYLLGWILPLLLFVAPIVSYSDISSGYGWLVLTVVGAGYAVSVFAGRSVVNRRTLGTAYPMLSRSLLRLAVIFSILSLIGGQLVLNEQSNFLEGWSFDNLEERYLALIHSSYEGTATNSIWSTLGNLMRSLFFVAVTAIVVYTKIERLWLRRIGASALVGAALLQSFFVNVSRLQFVFLLINAAVVAILVGHPILRQKKWLVAAAVVLVLFLIRTTDQRLASTFNDDSSAANGMVELFGADLQPLGQFIVDHLGLSAFILVLYISQAIPEFVRLVIYNPSPYAWGAHSFFPVVSPIARALGSPLTPDMSAISNQGLWWGFLGDMYLDFGAFYFIAYLCALFVMIRVARGFESSGVFGLTFSAMTVSMILIIPFTGIFNTYAVSYFALLILAVLEKRSQNLRRPAELGFKHA
jgi:hypothetical protein